MPALKLKFRVQGTRNRLLLLFIGLGLPALGLVMTLVVLLYLFGTPPLLQQQNTLTHMMTRMSVRLYQMEVELDRLVTLSTIRYDRLHWLVHNLQSDLDRLTPLLGRYLADGQLQKKLHALNTQIRDTRPLIEHALRQQTVATTSYAMLPALTEKCLAGEPATAQQRQFLLALMQTPITARNDSKRIDQLIDRLPEFLDSLPPEAACDRLHHHSQTFLTHYRSLLKDYRALNTSPLSSLMEEINHRFDTLLQAYIDQQTRIKQMLLSFLIAIILYTLFTLWLLHRQLEQLERHQRELNKLNALYRALSGINDVLVNASDYARLFRETCRILLNELDIAGVVVLDQPDDKGLLHVRCLSLRRSEDQDLVKSWKLHIGIDRNRPEGQGLSAAAWHSGTIQVVHDYQSDPRFAPWLPMARRLNIHSMVAIPLRVNGQTRAVMLMYHTEKGWFDDEVLQLLREIQEDLAFALERMELLRNQQEQKLLLQLAEVAFNAHEGIAIATEEDGLIRTNEAMQQMTGFTAEELITRRLEEIIEPKALLQQVLDGLRQTPYWHGELGIRRKDGSVVPARISLTRVKPSLTAEVAGGHLRARSYLVLQALDLSQQRELEQKLRESRHTDPVTGLPNRQGLLNNLRQVLEHVMPEDAWGVLSIINIRHFKAINDSFGHHGGDELLRQVAHRLRENLDFPHLTARDGNDEFVILPLLFSQSREQMQQRWQALFSQIEAVLMAPMSIQNHQVQVEIYAGTTFFTPGQIADSEALLNQAESAVRRAKSSRSQQQYFYDSDNNREAQKLVTLRHDLENALRNHELVLHYQPLLHLESGQLPIAEALLRWQRKGELVPPGEFISVLEQSPQLMVRVGHWIIQQAAVQCAQISHALNHPFGIAINLSAIQFSDPHLEKTLESAVRKHGIQPAQLTLEVTETALVENLDATVATLTRLKALGFRIAIDDFGTGYSSLQYLHRFAVDKLKLDKTFVDALDEQNPTSMAIPEATIAMAHALGARVVAEGVETEAQLDLLKRMGCDLIQGYLIARPMPLAELIQRLRAQ